MKGRAVQLEFWVLCRSSLSLELNAAGFLNLKAQMDCLLQRLVVELWTINPGPRSCKDAEEDTMDSHQARPKADHPIRCSVIPIKAPTVVTKN